MKPWSEWKHSWGWFSDLEGHAVKCTWHTLGEHVLVCMSAVFQRTNGTWEDELKEHEHKRDTKIKQRVEGEQVKKKNTTKKGIWDVPELGLGCLISHKGKFWVEPNPHLSVKHGYLTSVLKLEEAPENVLFFWVLSERVSPNSTLCSQNQNTDWK